MSSITPDETLLGLLAAQARHGYQLLECFRNPAELGEVWNLSTSQLYAVLKRLASQGLIRGESMESPDAPTRMEYDLTESGRARLEAWLHDDQPTASIRRVRVEFLSRLYIARLLNLPTIGIVNRQKAVCRRKHAELLLQRNEFPPGVGFLALELMIAQLEAVLGWIDRCELVPRDLGEDEL
jgi:DNA-binding PadR family transcriptional regulator